MARNRREQAIARGIEGREMPNWKEGLETYALSALQAPPFIAMAKAPHVPIDPKKINSGLRPMRSDSAP